VAGQAWSAAENEATVAAYFAMLRLEFAGNRYIKSEHNERLRQLLNGRTRQAIEYKFQNISAVLLNHDQVYIKGYLPAQNYQRALETAVLEWVEGSSDLAEVVATSRLLNPPSPEASLNFRDILSSAPVPGRASGAGQRRTNVAVKIDFVRRDAENRALGTRGEEFVVDLERRRLHDEEKRPDLAKRVRWSSRDEGDGLGYDITSFERDGGARLIEVKTTGLGKYFPFALTQNELACSQRIPEQFKLYRLYDFGDVAGLYILSGPLDRACTLSATVYRASVGREE
jgi:hypothetical protein